MKRHATRHEDPPPTVGQFLIAFVVLIALFAGGLMWLAILAAAVAPE
jgi:hypothetical protein